LEIAFRSGHSDRGFLISDRPVVQPVAWLSAGGTDLSAWGNLPLSETTDGARPEILEIELTREHTWKRLTIAPAVRAYFYHDPLSPYNTRSIEGWLHLSFDTGPFSLFMTHSLDVETYQGAYFVDAGIKSEHSVSDRLEIGGSLGAGWASARFNDMWVGVARSALNRVSAEGWLTAHVNSRYYIAPHVEFSTLLDRDVRAAALRPGYVRVGLAVGGEF